MASLEEKQKNYAPLAPFIFSAQKAFDAEVLYVENGEHKAGKRVELKLGEAHDSPKN